MELKDISANTTGILSTILAGEGEYFVWASDNNHLDTGSYEFTLNLD